MGKILFQKTKNKVFKDVTPEGFAEVFQKVLADEKSKLAYPQVINAYYAQNNYDPMFVMDHIFNTDLKTLVEYYRAANEHGLDPNLFHESEITQLINKFYNKKEIKTLDQAYYAIAELELLTANSLITYSNAMQYGLINPAKLYKRYFTSTAHPDSASMSKIFAVTDLKKYLDSIQPPNPQYLALQKALMSGQAAPGLSAEETKRILITGLERLRWKNKPADKKYVIVNIPDFRLDLMEDGRSVLNMKVCVGQGRNMDNAKTLMHYDDTDKVDKPYIHETPQLNSLIHSVDVNPIWNIPQSIANKEIIKEAAEDPNSLEDKGINVYKDGVLVHPESVDWSTVSKTDNTYEFKQQPGAKNALGKIKFLFNNKSSVYLHDTPVKSAFQKSMRAISHGCVRLENPQGLALNLFGEGDKYNLIAKDMGLDKPEPTSISLTPKVPVYITYVTCWVDDNGTLQVRPDVYGLDIVLYNALMSIK